MFARTKDHFKLGANLIGKGNTSVNQNKLNLGCGTDIRSGWVNLDIAPLPGVDVIHDLKKLPLPFPDNTFDFILAKDVLEHVDLVPVMGELHRILKKEGTLKLQSPHFTGIEFWQDPTHVKSFSIRTFEFFVKNSKFNRDFYFNFHFEKILNRRISFHTSPFIFWYNFPLSWLVNLTDVTRKYYEMTPLSRFFPAQNIHVSLIK